MADLQKCLLFRPSLEIYLFAVGIYFPKNRVGRSQNLFYYFLTKRKNTQNFVPGENFGNLIHIMFRVRPKAVVLLNKGGISPELNWAIIHNTMIAHPERVLFTREVSQK